VAAVAVVLVTEIVEITVDVAEGTVYKSAVVDG
jgi:hypothetical protein